MLPASKMAAGIAALLACAAGAIATDDPPLPPAPCAQDFADFVSGNFAPYPALYAPLGPVGYVQWGDNGLANIERGRIGFNRSNWHASGVPDLPDPAAKACHEQPSSCWRIDPGSSWELLYATRPSFGDSRGFPANFDVFNVPVTPNYPPVSQQAFFSTAPLVSSPGARTYRPQFLADRSLIAGIVDPITGQPLVREVDLELPVGSATYRFIRSYGGNGNGLERELPYGGAIPPHAPYAANAQNKMWDWAGTGWMLSDNPLLLFDAQYMQFDPSLPRRCLLILDAHHCIPFTQDVLTATYAAPAWFDAILTTWHRNSAGVLTPTSTTDWQAATTTPPQPAHWVNPPNTLKIKLYGESVTYTFDINYDDMPKLPITADFEVNGTTTDPRHPDGLPDPGRMPVSAHDSPRINRNNGQSTVEAPQAHESAQDIPGGLGTPYMALLKQIEDRAGNRVVITHCDPRPDISDFKVVDGNCASCSQRCNEKGQIKTIKLYAAGSSTPAWTLLYVHRAFRLWAQDLSVYQANPGGCRDEDDHPIPPDIGASVDKASRYFLQNALHAVYVYRNADPVTSAMDSAKCWTLPADAFVGDVSGSGFSQTYSTLDDQDTSNWTEQKIQNHLEWTVPPTWTYRLRFTYDETIRPLRCDAGGDTRQFTTFAAGAATAANVPGIFRWGTPLVEEQIDDRYEIQDRYTPSLLRVEKTERSGGSPPVDNSQYTAYCYATVQDEGLNLIAGRGSSNDPAGQFENAPIVFPTNDPPPGNPKFLTTCVDHSRPWITPRLKHIIRNSSLRRLVSGEGFANINKIFNPDVNRRSWAKYADVTLDWGLSSPQPPTTSVEVGAEVVEQVTAPWMLRLLSDCVINKVPRERTVLGWRHGVVSRVRINAGQPIDGIYDLTYFTVIPNGYEASESPAIPVGILPGKGEFGIITSGIQNYRLLPFYYQLFPFAWTRLALGDGGAWSTSNSSDPDVPIVGASPYSDPMFMTLVDRHDGTAAGAADDQNRPLYMQRYLLSRTSEADVMYNGLPIRPHSRELVGLNPAGFVLFDRRWDYQNDGASATGPTEEFIYEEVRQRLYPDDPNDTREQVTGMRLTEHRSLNWGVAFEHDSRNGSCPHAGTCGADIGEGCESWEKGLITKYSYLNIGDTHTTLLTGVAIKEGTGGHGAPDVPIRSIGYTSDGSTVNNTQSYRYQAGGSTAAATMTTDIVTAKYPDDPAVDDDGGIERRSTFRSEAPISPDGTTLSPFETQLFDEHGFLAARAYGMVADRTAPLTAHGEHDTVFVDVYGYQDGLKRFEIIDANIAGASQAAIEAAAALAVAAARPAVWGQVPNLPSAESMTSLLVAVAARVTRHVPNELGSLMPPLNSCTGFAYNGPRLEVVAKPGARFDFFIQRDDLHPSSTVDNYQDATVLLTYSDGAFVAPSESNHTIEFGKPGGIAALRAGETKRSWTVQWMQTSVEDGRPVAVIAPCEALFIPDDMADKQISMPTCLTGNPSFMVLSETTPSYDDSGRPTKVATQGLTVAEDTEFLEREAVFTDFGLVSRRREPSGSLVRMVQNQLGQTVAEFRGTSDRSDCWQNRQPGESEADNMLLQARHFYGRGISDIHQMVMSRHYDTAVKCDGTDYTGNGDTSFPSDALGWTDLYGYDRRGRRVCVESYGKPGEGSGGDCVSPPTDLDGLHVGNRCLLRAEYTWLDNLDRPRFSATFAPAGAGLLRQDADVDPRKRDCYLLGDPLATKILTFNPLRLSETIYNQQGQVEEQREYDAQAVGAQNRSRYVSTRNYYDHAGRVLVSISSTGRWTRNIYDALGRLTSTSTLRGEVSGGPSDNKYEIERTEYAYNVNGQAERISRFERVVNDPEPLTVGMDGNAVRSDQLVWFDQQGRVVATADLGSLSSDGVYRSESYLTAPPTQPSQADYKAPPMWNGSILGWTWPTGWPQEWRHARVTTTKYDDAGRVSETRGPDGVWRKMFYDGLGRVVEEQVRSAAGNGASPKPEITAYEYRNGKVVAIAAVRSEDQVRLPNGRIDFGINDDPRMLTTRLVYGDPYSTPPVLPAIVVDASGVPASADYDKLVGVRFPSVSCPCDVNHSGVVTVQDLFDFLALYFAGDPAADINLSGSVTVQDIFDFLTCYFTPPVDCSRTWSTTANSGLDIKFSYTIDGMVAQRSDLASVVPGGVTRLGFHYDSLRRKTEVIVDSGATDVADSVSEVSYAYDVLDRLTDVAARSHSSGQPYTVASSHFEHDSFGHLLSERLRHGNPSESAVAPLVYTWEYAAGPDSVLANRPYVPRLSSMAMPWSAGNSPLDSSRRSAFGYDYAAAYDAQAAVDVWLDNSLHRVRQANWWQGAAGSPVQNQDLIRYSYAGTARRTSQLFGPMASGDCAVSQSVAGSSSSFPGLAGLDRFGRTIDLEYRRAPGTGGGGVGSTLFHSQLTYDNRGNITSDRITQLPTTQTTGTDRSWKYGYDGLSRLLSAATGTLDSAGQFGASPYLKTSQRTWGLDELGNWNAQNSNDSTQVTMPGGTIDRTYGSDGLVTSTVRHAHVTNARHEIGAIQEMVGQGELTPDDPPDPLPPTTSSAFAYDPAGRMVYDGRLLYEHDAFGRVVQVREVNGSVDINSIGQMTNLSADRIGRVVAHFSYDGLGRLIRTQRPESLSGDTFSVTDTYYDGVRPVQEVGWKGVPARVVTASSPTGGSSTSTYKLPRRANELDDSLPENQRAAPWAARRLEREYLWAADPGGYVDECVAQLVYTQAHAVGTGEQAGQEVGNDTTPTILYTLNDHTSSVAGLTDAAGRMVCQYSYTPYGELRASEYFDTQTQGATSTEATEALAAARSNRLGHQGLFTVRFDRPWDGAMEMGTAVMSGTNATGPYRTVCHNRNRMYDPALGRFLENDPNGLGVPVLNGLAHAGMPTIACLIDPDLTSYSRNGMNTHAAFASDPLARVDPLGTEWIENYEGIVLPLMQEVEGQFLPVSGIGPLMDLLEGYQNLAMMIGFVNRYVQGGAYDEEEQLDWAMDWSDHDADNPRFGTGVQTPIRLGSADDGESWPSMAGVRGVAPRKAVRSGRLGQNAGERDFRGAVPCKHYLHGEERVGRRTVPFRRKYDTEIRSNSGHYMEIKNGAQSLTQRTKNQITRDRILMATNGKVRSVKWVFYTKNGTAKGIAPEILAELDRNGIEWAIARRTR